MSIKIQDLTKVYNTQKAVDKISFEVHTGEIAGFIGPNGAGKSTTMKIITGFLPPTSGSVWLNNQSIFDNPVEIRRQIGYLPEHNPLYTDLYIKESLIFTAGIYKVKATRKLIDDIIELTGLGIEQNKKIGELSKGYRQRVGLAQSLIHNPSILILDEPTTGLDPNQIVEIRNIIAEIGKQKTIMLSTHIMQEVEAICDRIIIINSGVIVANELRANIQNISMVQYQVYQVEFEDKIDADLLKSIEYVVNVIQVDDTKLLLESTEDIRKAIFHFAVQHKNAVLSMHKKEKSLEELFQEITKKN